MLKQIKNKCASPKDTTRETVTTATEIQQKTVEGFCGFGRVVGVIL